MLYKIMVEEEKLASGKFFNSKIIKIFSVRREESYLMEGGKKYDEEPLMELGKLMDAIEEYQSVLGGWKELFIHSI